MRLLIHKEGQQLGPYTLEEARALVLSGQLAATDWAWPDGATQWVPLKDVPGFSAIGTGPGVPPPPSAPASALNTEEELWRGRPSALLLLKLYVTWAIVLLGLFLATLMRFHVGPVLALLTVLACLQIALRNLRRRSIQYVVTTQRIRVISGICNQDIQEIELFRVKDTMVRQKFSQRLFGLGTITIVSGDSQHPRLVLEGIPHAVDLRERLRQEVMALRQRYGVRELDVM